MFDGFGQNELMDEPLFLKVRPGDAVLYEKDQIGKVLTFVGGSRDPDAPSLFQIANVDSGEIRWIHGEEVTEIVCEYRTTIKNLLLSTSKFSSNSSSDNQQETPLEIPITKGVINRLVLYKVNYVLMRFGLN